MTGAAPIRARAGHGRRDGRRRRGRPPGSRSYADIVRSNTFTVFNLILGTLFVLMLALGSPRDALFGGVIVANTLIGIIQEVRAKRVLDRIALMVAPRARVRRDGGLVEVAAEVVAVGDVLHLEPGDQLVADGEVLAARGLALDESILTGESDPVRKAPGDAVRAGAYCVEGAGEVAVLAVGADSWAENLAAEARGTRARPSPLQHDINRVLRATVVVMVPLAVVLITVLVLRREDFFTGARTAVAALVPLVPEGLVLLASLTFAVAAVRLARMGALVQRLNAVESLASVDVVCVDKTGTLTDNRLSVVAVEAAEAGAEPELRDLLGALVASVGDRNATMRAIHDAFPSPAREVLAEVPFSSARKWSGLTLAGVGTVVLGAPDVLAAQGVDVDPAVAERVASHGAARRRVLLVAVGEGRLDPDAPLPPLRAEGLVALGEGLRDDAVDTVRFLREQGTALKVISGDGVATVRAVAEACGVPDAGRAIAGEDLPHDPAELERVADEMVVFGRITPEQKRDIVAALERRGRYVAMIGDGVNDVLALKEARLAIGMGSGSQIAKGVSDMILMRGGFATLPTAIGEGRRIIRNTHRVAKLFVTKTVYAALLLATIGLAPIAFPFLPRHLTVTASLTIGIPAFFLALAPSSGPVRREAFTRDLARFTVPIGIITAVAIAAGYLIVRGPLDGDVAEGRTVAVMVATGMGLAIVVALERDSGRVRWWVWAMVAAFALAFTAGLSVAPLRDFFDVRIPSSRGWAAAGVVTAVGILLIPAVLRLPLRRLGRLRVPRGVDPRRR